MSLETMELHVAFCVALNLVLGLEMCEPYMLLVWWYGVVDGCVIFLCSCECKERDVVEFYGWRIN